MKKFFAIMLSFAIFFVSLTSLPSSTLAVGESAILRVVGGSVGERIVIAQMEKAGIKYTTKKAKEIAVERWNLDVYNKIKQYEKLGKEFEAEELRRFQNSVATAKTSDLKPTSKIGSAGQFVVSGTAAILGLDIAWGTGNFIWDSINGNNPFQVSRAFSEAMEDDGGIIDTFSIGGGALSFGYKTCDFNGPQTCWGVSTEPLPQYADHHSQTIVKLANQELSDLLTVDVKSISTHTTRLYLDYAAFYTKYGNPEGTLFNLSKQVYVDLYPYGLTGDDITNADPNQNYAIVTIYPDSMPLPQIGVKGWNDPDLIPDQGIPLEVPETLDYPEVINDPYIETTPGTDPGTDPGTGPGTDPGTGTNPWNPLDPSNPPLPEAPPGGQPVDDLLPPPDTGIPPDPTDPVNGVPGQVIPFAPFDLLLAFIEFLIACMWFVISTAAMIFKLPTISAQSIPSPYGDVVQSFMDMEYMNINTWDLLITLSTTLLIFTVYKIVRRVVS